jgi:DsbC/DsbD-like thiol-disulfide interchange protein
MSILASVAGRSGRGAWWLVAILGLAQSACAAQPPAGGEAEQGPAGAPAEAQAPEAEPNKVRAELVLSDAPEPGRTIWLGVRFLIEEHWHIYADTLNDTGVPPKVEWTLPEGWTVGPWVWPGAKRYTQPGEILDHVYEREVTLLAPLKVPADAKPGTEAMIRAKLDWLVCKDICIPEEQVATKPVRIGTEPSDVERRGIQRALDALPRPTRLDAAGTGPMVEGEAKVVAVWTSPRTIVIEVDGPVEKLEFMPARPPAEGGVEFENLFERGISNRGRLELKVKSETSVRGTLGIYRSGTARPAYHSIRVEAREAPAEPVSKP